MTTDTSGDSEREENVHIAPNYKKGGVWFRLGAQERLLLSPADARKLANKIESHPVAKELVSSPKFDMGEMIDDFRQLADECEEANPNPTHGEFHDLPEFGDWT